MNHPIFTNKNIPKLKTQANLLALLRKKGVEDKNLQARIDYTIDLELLQLELLKLQNWILKKKKRIVIIFEGRDAAGKGGAIKRFIKYLNPRSMRVVALGKPTDVEKGQWYFRRHIKELPIEGEIVFFDRSWYNRAVVEPVMDFCNASEYQQFIRQVPEFEHLLYEDGVTIIKFWFAISKDEQARRFNERQTNPLKQWKLSPVDIKSRDEWDEYSRYIEEMFVKTHTNFCPWVLVNTDNKRAARLESIRHVLSLFDYKGKENTQTILYPDPSIVQSYYRSNIK
jgi:polyphosphate kinase 2